MKIEPICCSLNPSQMEERKKTFQKFKTIVIDKEEIENGFAFKFEGSNEIMDEIISIIKLERLCCPFLTFNLTVEKETSPFLLKITGPEGTKDFLLNELGI